MNCCTQVFVRVAPTLKPAAQQYPALAAGRNYTPASIESCTIAKPISTRISRSIPREGGISGIADWNLGAATLTVRQRVALLGMGCRERSRLHVVEHPNASAHSFAPDPVQPGAATCVERRQEAIDWLVGLYAFEQNVKRPPAVTEYGRDAAYWLLGPNGECHQRAAGRLGQRCSTPPASTPRATPPSAS